MTAEALALRIADEYEQMDTWWTRDGNELVTVEPRGDDAAELVLGVKAITVSGNAQRAAHVTGTVDLSAGVDLRETAILRLNIDETQPVEIDLTAGEVTVAIVVLDEIVTAINNTAGATVARHDGRFLTLGSSTVGAVGRLEVQDVANDAAERILGLLPRIYHGSEALAAQVTGTVDRSSGVDLSQDRYLRLVVDGTHLAEIDCADSDNPAQTTLDQVQDAINSTLGIDAASHDDHFLTLKSPTTGFQSTIAFQPPAAQDATARLFGTTQSFYSGRDAQRARITGRRRDLSSGVDLSEHSNIQVRVDGAASVTIDCAGADAANTRPAEIVAAINAALGGEVASHNGRFVTLSSPTIGPTGKIVVETPLADDATEDIFGIGPRIFEGTAATAAHIVGHNLSADVNVMALHSLKLVVDGGPPAEIDLQAGATDPGAVSLHELTNVINNALNAAIASHDGSHLILTSPTSGGASSLKIEPLETTQRRRFVTRAAIVDEASPAIFGFFEREAFGTPATSARPRAVEEPDLSRGVDLRAARYLRLTIDGWPAVDIDCAGTRPRATMIDEVVKAINYKLKEELPLDKEFLFNVGLEYQSDLEQSVLSEGFRQKFESHGVSLSDDALITTVVEGRRWRIKARHQYQIYTAIREEELLNIYDKKDVAAHDGRHLKLTSPTVGGREPNCV